MFCFAVIQYDGVRWFFVRWIVILVCDGLAMSNECEVCLDSCMEGDGEYTYVDMLDDIHEDACVVI